MLLVVVLVVAEQQVVVVLVGLEQGQDCPLPQVQLIQLLLVLVEQVSTVTRRLEITATILCFLQLLPLAVEVVGHLVLLHETAKTVVQVEAVEAE